jgi:hypothetical protein
LKKEQKKQSFYLEIRPETWIFQPTVRVA